MLRWTVILLLFAVAAGLSGLQATTGPSLSSAKGLASVLVLGIALLALAGIAVLRRLSRTPR